MRNLFAIAVVALLWSPLASASTKIPLFLKSQSSEGFTDPSEDRRDSEKDLLKRLKKCDEFLLVETEEEAVIVLEVLDRAESQQHGPFAGNTQRKKTLNVRLNVGEFSAEFAGDTSLMSIGGGWGVAAKSVVNQIRDWAKENSAKLNKMQ